MHSETLSLAMSLLEYPSVTPADQGAQQLIAQRLARLGFEIRHFPFNQVSNLWAKKGSATPCLCFAGHTDVVPPGDLTAWVSPPFTPTIRNGKLYGRGAADMKSSIAAMITACERFIQQYPDHGGSLAFLITSDEEGPAIDGTQAVLKELEKINEIPQWCLVGEASSSEKLADTIKVGRRGTLTGYLKIHGIQGHVAYPHLGKNPIHLSLKPLQAIVDHVFDEGTDLFPATSLQIANIQAGTGATNVIPASLSLNFNLRFSPLTTPVTIQKTIEQLLSDYDCQYDIQWHLGGNPFLTPQESPFLKIISETIEKEMGYKPLHSTSGGTSDGRFFAEYGTHVVEVGPNNSTIHQINECIDIKELDALSALYEKILIALLIP